jgi:hypothetical protein
MGVGHAIRRLRRWSLVRLALVCAGWLVFSVVAIAIAFVVQLYALFAFAPATGSGGIGAVSAGVFSLVLEIIVFAPIIALVILWVWQRRR